MVVGKGRLKTTAKFGKVFVQPDLKGRKIVDELKEQRKNLDSKEGESDRGTKAPGEPTTTASTSKLACYYANVQSKGKGY